MALAAEPAVTGKLPGDSGGRGVAVWLPNPEPQKKETLHLGLRLSGLDPAPRPVSRLRKEPFPLAQPSRLSHCRPGGLQERQLCHTGTTLVSAQAPSPPGCSLCCASVCPAPPPASSRASASRAQLSPATPRLWLPSVSAHSQPQEAPRQRRGATHSWVHGNRREPREFQSSPGGARAGGKLEPPEPGLCWPLPAGFAAQHTRSCCDYKRLLWDPSQERCAATPTLPCRGRGPGHRQPAGPAQHLSLPCPSVSGDFSLVGQAHTRGPASQDLPEVLRPCAPA